LANNRFLSQEYFGYYALTQQAFIMLIHQVPPAPAANKDKSDKDKAVGSLPATDEDKS